MHQRKPYKSSKHGDNRGKRKPTNPISRVYICSELIPRVLKRFMKTSKFSVQIFLFSNHVTGNVRCTGESMSQLII